MRPLIVVGCLGCRTRILILMIVKMTERLPSTHLRLQKARLKQPRIEESGSNHSEHDTSCVRTVQNTSNSTYQNNIRISKTAVY